jgi:hypothetical protein
LSARRRKFAGAGEPETFDGRRESSIAITSARTVDGIDEALGEISVDSVRLTGWHSQMSAPWF